MRDKKVKVGRPPMPKGEAKDVVLQSRVQLSEREKYRKAAKAAGLDLSTWVREVLNRAVQ
jgi:predicted HicB family RNase H-like nuclease